jgi:DNA-directed RNA polymerase specialized sigma24 family protein
VETGFPRELDAFARGYLTSAAKRLDATVPCVPCSEDDYLQELQLNLWRRQPKFDASRSSWTTFVKLVTDHRSIELRQRCRTGRCKAIAPVIATDSPNELLDLSPDSHERRMIALDIDAWLRSLDPDEQKLCRLLMIGSVSETARELNSPRTTVLDKISRMRKRHESSSLKDFAPRPRNLPTSAR